MYKLFLICSALLIIQSCTAVDSETKRIYNEEYPNLYEAVYQRDGDRILEFVSSTDSLIQIHAWRSLIQTPVDDLDKLIQMVMQTNSDEAWASLWFKNLNEKHIEYFKTLWNDIPHLRSGLLVLFSEVGDRSIFELLLNTADTGDLSYDYKLAYAIGARSRQIELTSEEEIQLIDRALSTKDGKKTQAYLYGYYRARKQFSIEAEQHALSKWDEYYPATNEGNQSLVRILSANNLDVVLRHFPIESYERMDVQLAVEITQAIARYEPTDYSQVISNALLDHRNPNVQIAALQAIQRHPEVADKLFRDIMNKIALIDYRGPLARMEAFNTINNPEEYIEEVLATAGDNPSLQALKYEILEKAMKDDGFVNLLFEDLSNEDRLLKFYAVQYLATWWPEADDNIKNTMVDDVKTIVIEIAKSGDRSMTTSLTPIFMDSFVFPDEDYPIFEELLSEFQLPEDVEVYQSLSQVLYVRFEEKAQSLIDSLSMVGNQALNRTLIIQGWDILQGDYYPEEFREPDWSRVSKLTANPYVVIETSKGDIILELDIGKAPVTIAGMDSLMQAGAYQNTPFHRVIPNFVIQGGDVETKDGFGSGGYVVPTEASSTMYNRGIVGIASAGVDTESSQFFIMHQWKPHLNGRYSVIGEVVEGMEVVDRIVQGDIIEHMYWY
jgi:cyclophilin family peptidyl-prolyl cis-trans isomerase